MSRIGNKIIEVPEGVTFEIKDDLFIAKGPKGEFAQKFERDFEITQNEKGLSMKRPSDQKSDKAKHGLYRSLINNALIGVLEGYRKELELVGVGYKATAQNNVLELSLGYSHNIHFGVPAEVKVKWP